jgi:chlorobactene glucosyltransferase
MLLTITVIAITSALALLWIVYQGIFLNRKIPILEGPAAATGGEFVSIIVPARNEAADIIPCLETLVAQDYRDREIIVVNDNSEDATGDLVRQFAGLHPEVRLVDGRPLEKGWIGKTFAMSQGVAAARGRLLAFVDADARHAPSELSTAVARFRQDGLAILSILPFLDAGSFWERVVYPFVAEIFLLSLPFEKVNDPRSDVVLANGQFLLTSRDFLDRIGGLESIKGNILDDVSLARKAKDHGERAALFYGPTLLHLRMYDSLANMIKGWSRSFYRGFLLSYHALMLWPVTLALLILFVGPLVFPIAVIGCPLPVPVRVFTFAPLALELCFTLWKRARFGWQPASSWSEPLAACIYVVIVVTSFVRTTLQIGVEWRGRSYYTRDHGGGP